MKQGNYIILFAILLGSCLLWVWAEQYRYDSMRKEREQIEAAVQQAIGYAAECVAKEYSVSEDTISELAKEAFFETLYAALGAFGDREKMLQIEMCVPMVAVLLREGAYFYYLGEGSAADGSFFLERTRSGQYPYVYEGEAFSYRFFLDGRLYVTRRAGGEWICTSYEKVAAGEEEWEELLTEPLFSSEEAYAMRKQEAIAEAVTEAMGTIVPIHNRIAGQYGVAYVYTVPDFLRQQRIATEHVSVLAVVQGWPLTGSGMDFYESCVEAGAYIGPAKLYCLEKPVLLEQPYAVFHRQGCHYLGSFGAEAGQMGLEEAVKKHGAFGCPYCILETEAVLLPK